MGDKEKVSRRNYVRYAGAGVVVVAGAAAGAYYVSRPSPPQTTTAATTTTTAAAGCTCDSGCDGTAISPDFTKDGAGQFCWQATSGTYINSWNTTKVEVNNTDYTNLYVLTSNFPAKINGVWYIYYNSSVAWGHFELNN